MTPTRSRMRSRAARPRARRAGAAARRRAGAEPGAAQERILAAALQVFAERGFDGARTREIAERAGANLGLLSYYFEGKEQLWRAAVERAFGELRAELGAVAALPGREAPEDARSRLAGLLRRFVLFVARRPEFMRLMNDEGKRDGPRMRWLADHHVRPFAEGLRVLVEHAQSSGALPAAPAASLHYLALGAAGLLFSQAPECRYLTGVDPTAPGFAEAHADALVRILLGPESPARS